MDQFDRPEEGGATQPGFVARVRDRANAELAWQKGRVTDGLGTLARAARDTTHQLREQQHDHVAHYVEKAADHLERFSTRLQERFSTRLQEKDVAELVNDVQRFARRRPVIFIASAFAVGFVCSRLWRNSSDSSSGSGHGVTELTGHEWTEKVR